MYIYCKNNVFVAIFNQIQSIKCQNCGIRWTEVTLANRKIPPSKLTTVREQLIKTGLFNGFGLINQLEQVAQMGRELVSHPSVTDTPICIMHVVFYLLHCKAAEMEAVGCNKTTRVNLIKAFFFQMNYLSLKFRSEIVWVAS